MLGANWQSDPQENVIEKFAWWPVKSTWSKKIIWFRKYMQMDVYYDSELSNPIRSNTFTFRYTQNEYLLYLLRKNEGSVLRSPLPSPLIP